MHDFDTHVMLIHRSWENGGAGWRFCHESCETPARANSRSHRESEHDWQVSLETIWRYVSFPKFQQSCFSRWSGGPDITARMWRYNHQTSFLWSVARKETTNKRYARVSYYCIHICVSNERPRSTACFSPSCWSICRKMCVGEGVTQMVFNKAKACDNIG